VRSNAGVDAHHSVKATFLSRAGYVSSTRLGPDVTFETGMEQLMGLVGFTPVQNANV